MPLLINPMENTIIEDILKCYSQKKRFLSNYNLPQTCCRVCKRNTHSEGQWHTSFDKVIIYYFFLDRDGKKIERSNTKNKPRSRAPVLLK